MALIVLTMVGIVGFRPAYGGHGYLAVGAAGVVLGLLLSHVGQRARLPLSPSWPRASWRSCSSAASSGQTGTREPAGAPLRCAGVAVSGWTAAADHRPAGRPHRRAARAAVPARPVQRRGGARARAPHRARRAARRRARRRGRAVHPVRRGAADRRRAAGRRLRDRRARLGAPRASSAAARERTTVGRQRPWQRIGAAVAVLAVAGAGATVIGPRLPGANAHPRVVLYVEPPFDVSAYPSPLAGFRDYTQDVPTSLSVYGKELLATTGLPGGQPGAHRGDGRLRRAFLGRRQRGGGSSSFSGYQRVGAPLPGALPGPTRTATITVEPAYDQPWLPDLADTTGFALPVRPAAVRAALRFNVATTTGIIPDGCPRPALHGQRGGRGGAHRRQARVREPGRHARPGHHDPRRGPGVRPGALRDGDQPDGQGPRARRVPAGQRQVQQRRGRAERDHRRARLRRAHLLPRGQADHRRRRAVRRHDGAARQRGGVPARVSLDGNVEANGTVYGKDVRADVDSTRPSTAG